MTNEEKALAILHWIHDYCRRDGGRTNNHSVRFHRDWDENTMIVYLDNEHFHLGQMNKEGEDGFSVLLSEMYNLFKAYKE